MKPNWTDVLALAGKSHTPHASTRLLRASRRCHCGGAARGHEIEGVRLRVSQLVVSSERVVRDRLPTDPECSAMILSDLEGELFFGAAPELEYVESKIYGLRPFRKALSCSSWTISIH